MQRLRPRQQESRSAPRSLPRSFRRNVDSTWALGEQSFGGGGHAGASGLQNVESEHVRTHTQIETSYESYTVTSDYVDITSWCPQCHKYFWLVLIGFQCFGIQARSYFQSRKRIGIELAPIGFARAQQARVETSQAHYTRFEHEICRAWRWYFRVNIL